MILDKKGRTKIEPNDKKVMIVHGVRRKYHAFAYQQAANMKINSIAQKTTSNQEPFIKSLKVIFIFSFIDTLNIIFLPYSIIRYSINNEGIIDVVTKVVTYEVIKTLIGEDLAITALPGNVIAERIKRTIFITDTK